MDILVANLQVWWRSIILQKL